MGGRGSALLSVPLFVLVVVLVSMLMVGAGIAGPAASTAGPPGGVGLPDPLAEGHRDRVVFSDGGTLVIVDVATGERRSLDVEGTSPVWAPDGDRIAYRAPDGIDVLQVDDPLSQPQRIVRAESTAQVLQPQLAWHPNGSHLAFVQDAAVHVVAADGDTLGQAAVAHRVSDVVEGDIDEDPQWAPDGSALLFHRRYQPSGQDEFRVWPFSPSFPAEIPADRAVVTHDVLDVTAHATWLGSGGILVQGKVQPVGPDTPIALHRVDVAAGRLTQVGAHENEWAVRHPTASPDGSQVAYGVRCPAECTGGEQENGADGGIWLLDVASGDVRQLAVGDGEERRVRWTADRTRLVYEAVFQDSGCHCDVTDLWVAAADGTTPPRAIDGTSSADGSIVVGPVIHDVSPGRTRRLVGTTRVETALAISRATHATAEVALIARADGYADALAASGLAGDLAAPVLLSDRGRLPSAVRREVARLRVQRVILLGSESALSSAVAAALAAPDERGHAPTVERIAGPTRYATAAAVAERMAADHAFIVQGAAADPSRGWPDAVAVSALAAQRGQPVLLVERDRLPDETASRITEAGYGSVTIVGGTPSVSEGVADDLRALGVEVDRIAGASRYETSRAVAELAVTEGADPARTWFAIGGNWPDSLSAGPAAAHMGGTLLLTDGQHLDRSTPVRQWLADHDVTAGVLAGGEDVLSPAVRVQIERS